VFGGTTPVAVNISGGVTAGDITITNGAYAFGGSGTLTLNSGNIQVGAGLTAILSNAVAGTAGLTKTGAGTLVLTNNTKNFTGGTTISGGAVQITSISNGSLGSSNTATVVLNGGALHTLFGGNQNLSYNITVGASGGEIRNLGTDSQRATLLANKVIGSGTLTLSFGSVDTRIPVNGQSGFAGKWIVDSGGALNRYADIQTGAGLGTGTGDDVLTLQNNGRILHRGGTLGGATQGITLGTGTSRVSIAGGQTVNIAGKLSGPVANGLDIDLNNATSTGILSNAGNSFLGDLALYGPGFVLLGASGVLPDAGSVTVHTNATLDLNGYNEVIGGLSGMGTVNVRVASASVSLGVGANNSTSTFSGTLTNTASGSSLQLVKVGSGTLVLSGTGIGHAGGTIISNGAIEISAAGAGRLGPASSSAVTLNGGTLQGNFSTHATVGNAITVGSAGGTLRNIGNDGQRWTMSADQLSGSGTLTLAFGSQNTRFVMASSQAGFTGKWIIDSAGNVNRFVDLNYASGNGFRRRHRGRRDHVRELRRHPDPGGAEPGRPVPRDHPGLRSREDLGGFHVHGHGRGQDLRAGGEQRPVLHGQLEQRVGPGEYGEQLGGCEPDQRRPGRRRPVRDAAAGGGGRPAGRRRRDRGVRQREAGPQRVHGDHRRTVRQRSRRQPGRRYECDAFAGRQQQQRYLQRRDHQQRCVRHAGAHQDRNRHPDPQHGPGLRGSDHGERGRAAHRARGRAGRFGCRHGGGLGRRAGTAGRHSQFLQRA
jgi:autotransporter-associated beta strand protein